MQLILAEHRCKYSVGCIKAQITQSLTECFMLILVQINRNASIFHLWGRYTRINTASCWTFDIFCVSVCLCTEPHTVFSVKINTRLHAWATQRSQKWIRVNPLQRGYDAISMEHALRWLVWYLSIKHINMHTTQPFLEASWITKNTNAFKKTEETVKCVSSFYFFVSFFFLKMKLFNWVL